MKDDSPSLFNELINAIQTNNGKLVSDLIARDVDIEENDNQALLLACQLGHDLIVELLIDADVDIHQNSNEALWLAIINHHTAITAILLANDADILDRNGDIWKEATKANTSPEELTTFVQLCIKSESDIDYETLLDNSLSQGNLRLADTLAASLPKESWLTATLIALDHGNGTIAKLFLDSGVDFDQDNEKSAEAYYMAWFKGCKSLLPQLYDSGAIISGALDEYIYASFVSVSSLDAEFLTELLKLSKFEIEVCESIADIAISNKFTRLAMETIKHLANHSISLSSIFYSAILRDAEELYPLLMELKADISFTPNDYDWLNDFVVSDSTDRDLLKYLLAHVGPHGMLEYDNLIDKAISDKDWPWVRFLVCFGEKPSVTYALDMTVSDLIETVENDKAYQFSVLLQAAELAGGWAARNVTQMYMEGVGVEQNKEQADHWRNVGWA